MNKKDISIILVNYKNRELTVNCVRSILESGIHIDYEILIIDNHSEDESYGYFKQLYHESDDIRVFETDYNGGFAYGNNFGIKHSAGEYLFILNNDTELYPGIVDLLYEMIKKDTCIGVLGCKAVDRNGRELPTAQKYENYNRLLLQTYIKPITEKIGIQRWLVERFRAPRESEKLIYSDWIVGSAMMISKQLYYEIGGLDENYFMYMEDEDLCKRINQAMYKIATLNEVGYVHYCGGSTISSYFLTKECLKSKILYFTRYEKNNVKRIYKMFRKIIVAINPSLSKIEITQLMKEIESFTKDELKEKAYIIKGVCEKKI